MLQEEQSRDLGDRVARLATPCMRIALGLVLLGTASAKVVPLLNGREPDIMGLHGARAIAVVWGITGLEVLAAAMILSGWIRSGGFLTFAMGCGFGLFVAAILFSGLPMRACGCLGQVEVPVCAHLMLIFGLMLGGRFLMFTGATST